MDLNKIQNTIEAEIEKANAAERKRIVGLIKDFSKDLIDAIVNGEDDEAPTKPAKKIPAKKPAAKKAPTKKEAPVEKEEPSDGEPVEGNEYVDDIDDVEDDEVEESKYAGKKIGELRTICKDRNISIPKGFKVKEIQKLLILVDEDQE